MGGGTSTGGIPPIMHLESGDTQCPACGLLNPDVPEGPASSRCDVCIHYTDDDVR